MEVQLQTAKPVEGCKPLPGSAGWDAQVSVLDFLRHTYQHPQAAGTIRDSPPLALAHGLPAQLAAPMAVRVKTTKVIASALSQTAPTPTAPTPIAATPTAATPTAATPVHAAKATSHAGTLPSTARVVQLRTSPLSLSTEFRAWLRSEWLGFTGSRDISALCRAARTRTKREITETITQKLKGHAGVDSFISEFLRRLGLEVAHSTNTSKETSPQLSNYVSQRNLQPPPQPPPQPCQQPCQQYLCGDQHNGITALNDHVNFLEGQMNNMTGMERQQSPTGMSSYDDLCNRLVFEAALHQGYWLETPTVSTPSLQSSFSCFSPDALNQAQDARHHSLPATLLASSQQQELQMLMAANNMSQNSGTGKVNELEGEVANLKERLRIANERLFQSEELHRRSVAEALVAQGQAQQQWATQAECVSLREQLGRAAKDCAVYKLQAISMREFMGNHKTAASTELNQQLYLQNERLSEGLIGLREQLRTANQRIAYEREQTQRVEATLDESAKAHASYTEDRQSWAAQVEALQRKLDESVHSSKRWKDRAEGLQRKLEAQDAEQERLRRKLAAVTQDRDGLMSQLAAGSAGPLSSNKVTFLSEQQASEVTLLQKHQRLLLELRNVQGEPSLPTSV